jgi:protein-disulfide isomerase
MAPARGRSFPWSPMSIRHFSLTGAALLALAACQSPRSAPPSTTASTEKKEAPTTPVAKIGGNTITAAQLDDKIGAQLGSMEREYEQQVYQLKRQALESMIQEQLLDAKAKKENLSREELVKRDIYDKIAEPTDAEVKAFYENAKKEFGEVKKRNPNAVLPALDEVKDQIVNRLKSQQVQKLATDYLTELKKEMPVEVLLPAYQPPKVEVAADGPSRGPAAAPVTIIEFSDFQCPACIAAEPAVKQVLAGYGDKVRFVYRDFPLEFHPLAQKAAEASQCAQQQGKYWDMHDRLFATQGKGLEVPALKSAAKDLGLDTAKFDACLDKGETAATVQGHMKAGMAAGVKATPTFFINGRLYEGMLPPEELKKAIDGELATAGKTAQK